ncbi:MAG: flagellar M-ring protein FliF [Ignavibacteriales bacterium]|nr:flagellar M-ring protein FliF [Ignavibacteriales bacterium]
MILIIIVVLAAAAAVVGLVTVVNQPSYATLFTNLKPEDASKIVEKLKERKVPYTLDDGGKTIMVPKQQIYDLRLTLAGEGLPLSSVIGYEIFDRTNLGVSDFIQKINYRRALEGELARTILQIEEVEAARVHIVVPQKALFKEDAKVATASVILKLKSAKPPKRETIQGIAHLVASSVEGLEASNVSIVDARGVLLSENVKSNSLSALTSTQYEMQQKIESYLAQKAQILLDGVLGSGNSVVQVNAELNFRQIERTQEQYDPEKTAIRSEQTTDEKTSVRDSVQPSTRSNVTTNYEINKSIDHIVEDVGNIKRLSVAALINGKQQSIEKNGQKTTEYAPRTQDEMTHLSDIIKRAVGFSDERNDQVSVVNLPFGTNEKAEDFLYKEEPLANYYDWMEKGLLVVAMLGALIMVRSLLNRLRVQVATGSEMLGDPAIASLQSRMSSIQLPELTEEVSAEALLRAEHRKRVTNYLREKPDDAARLLKVWLAEEQ